jgi:mannonate dehydratase
MQVPINRRELLTILGLSALCPSPTATKLQAAPTLDLHVHLFGTGDSGSGCRLSKRITEGMQFRTLKLLLGIEQKGKTLDEGYVAVLLEQFKDSGLSKVAILGQDAVYDARGEPDWNRTSFYVPSDYVLKTAQAHPHAVIPCPSINPQRKDSIEELQRIKAKGAKLFKIHPPTQGVDVADKRHTKFFQKCVDLQMLVLVHTGHEHSAPVLDKELANPQRLELALDQGARVVACHCGTGWPSDEPDQLPAFLQLLKRYPNLWGDTAVLGTPGRVRDFFRLLDEPSAAARLLHGSDFPFPVAPGGFMERIGKDAVQKLNREKNWLKRDLDLKESLGVGKTSAQRAHELVLGSAT